MTYRFPRGPEYPGEQFVQRAVQLWFEKQGYEVAVGQSNPDLLARHPDGRSWHIEAKGETAAVGLDFRTGLGQLIVGMGDPSATYALAMPDTAEFRGHCKRVPDRVRVLLGLTWLFVAADGAVLLVGPDE